jgi:hypothetical protein
MRSGMSTSIAEQVIVFYATLFDRIFSEPFQSRIEQLLKRRDVLRQVGASADAASQSLTRFFRNEQLTEMQVAKILEGFVPLGDLLELKDISNANVTPEAVVERLLADLTCPDTVLQSRQDAIFRVALHSVVQVLMLVGPVMAEWQKLNFSSTFELPRRVVNRLNQISEQLDDLSGSGQAAVDERNELSYRDYLLQRFHRVEAGTVRMTTNLDIDLRELFVMPRVLACPLPAETDSATLPALGALMDLAAAREFFGDRGRRSKGDKSQEENDNGITALEQVKSYPRNVIIGAPGSGKSTFLEWLQVKLASVEEVLVMGGQQAIPLLLRMRQLDPLNLPRGMALIEKATASRDRAALMSPGWLDRQMRIGRVILMLDGLDETDPESRDRYVLPWLLELCEEYPDCGYLVSSRPAGYPPGTLSEFKFAECDLLDFNEAQIGEYTRHWCTAVRLAQNEPEGEARREGTTDGERIVEGFKDHPYIRNLARNPLMLSAICLVNYFEGGHLPQDRALLYRLCVEGLLHNWDQRRGIHSDFAFEEKLRTCREVALTMQADDRAEYEADKVQQIFAAILRDPARAESLLEHIRYRTGLLLERRPGIFAFAHLTFQEYLAALAVHEGNQVGVDVKRLVREHDDGRWQEVIALYCGLAPAPAARDMIEQLITQRDTPSLAAILGEAYLSSGREILQDPEFRHRVLERIATAPVKIPKYQLERFSTDEVARIANLSAGKTQGALNFSESCLWLATHSSLLDISHLTEQIREWRRMTPLQIGELILLLHAFGPDALLVEISVDADMYAASGPEMEGLGNSSQAEFALMGLSVRNLEVMSGWVGIDAALLQIFRVLRSSEALAIVYFLSQLQTFLQRRSEASLPYNPTTWPELGALARRLAERWAKIELSDDRSSNLKNVVAALKILADRLERRMVERQGQITEPKKLSEKSTGSQTT